MEVAFKGCWKSDEILEVQIKIEFGFLQKMVFCKFRPVNLAYSKKSKHRGERR